MNTETSTRIAAHPSLSKSKRGFTLTEIAIVLGIIGLILGAIWAAASSVYANQKANRAQQGILAAAQAVRAMYATSGNTGMTANTDITSAGMFPADWTSSLSTTTFGNPWHFNPAAAAGYSHVIGNGTVFGVELDGITDGGCAVLVGFYNTSAAGQNGGTVPGLVGSNLSTAAPGGGAAKMIGNAMPSAAANSFGVVPTGCKGGGLLDGVIVYFDMSIM